MHHSHAAVIASASCLLAGVATASQITADQARILDVMHTFMECITKRDPERFSHLFVDGPVAWIGVYKEASQQRRMRDDPRSAPWFSATYNGFYDNLDEARQNQEKFDNVYIVDDGSVASVTFDYSFWSSGKKVNWGEEHWELVKVGKEWRISSVAFSLELEEVLRQPPLIERVTAKNHSVGRF
jgi:hypothetical protein